MTHPLFLIALAASAAGGLPGESPEVRPMPTSIAPRDGNIAIREELDTARAKRTVEAYDLFIARHPDHPLAQIARRERRQLQHARR